MDDMKEKAENLIRIVDRLRKECPWDRKQRHETLPKYLQEESHEVIEAIYSGNKDRLKEELGDLLFQILFHARIAEESGDFDLGDIMESLSQKMTSRHPHVFGNAPEVADDEQALKDFWNKQKAEEKKGKKQVSFSELAELNGAALIQKALVMQNIASRKGFDWRSPQEIIEKLEEEIEELKVSLSSGNRTDIYEEIGDIILVVTNLCRFLTVDFEKSFEKALFKFAGRFDNLQNEVAKTGKPMEEFSIETLEKKWQEIKSQNRKIPFNG